MRSFIFVNLAGLAIGCSLSAQALTLSTLKARFDKVSVLESAPTRTVLFTVKTCAADPNIKSVSVSRNNQVLPTENAGPGCFSWKDSISHSYYSPEQFSEMKYSIAVDGTKQDQKLYVNPWDDKFTFGFDSREIADTSIVQKKGGVPT